MTTLSPDDFVVILTGSGISAESGLGTFREKDGLWTKYDLSEIATPEGYAADPEKVLGFYNARRRNLLGAALNAAHAALARLEAAHPGGVLIVTQNVDNLHEQAGARNVLHMHGELLKAQCAACAHQWPWSHDMTVNDACPACATVGMVRPDVVWFGEIPYHMETIFDALTACDLFVSIGTSGNVYPAAGFVAEAAAQGARTLELNSEPSEGASLFHEARLGPATQVVPAWVSEALGG